jgi:hypothetical protein
MSGSYKLSNCLLNVNYDKASLDNEYIRIFKDISGPVGISFFYYVSDSWFVNGIVEDICLFDYKNIHGRIFVDDFGLMWLEVYTFSIGKALQKPFVRVLLEGFYNSWHSLIFILPNNVFGGSLPDIYLDGVLQNLTVSDLGGALLAGSDFTVGSPTNVLVDESGAIGSGCFIGYIGGLYIFNQGQGLIDESQARIIANSGMISSAFLSNQTYPFNTYAYIYSHLRDRLGFRDGDSWIMNEKSGTGRDLKLFRQGSRAVKVFGNTTRKTNLTDREKYLLTTRNQNKFVAPSIPRYEFQNTWIKESLSDKSNLPDAAEFTNTYADVEQPTPAVDEGYRILFETGSHQLVGDGINQVDWWFDIPVPVFGASAGFVSCKMVFMFTITATSYALPDVIGKSFCIITDYVLDASDGINSGVAIADQVGITLKGPMSVPPLVWHDIDDCVWVLVNGLPKQAALSLMVPNFTKTGLAETTDVDYSIMICYSVADTTGVI